MAHPIQDKLRQLIFPNSASVIEYLTGSIANLKILMSEFEELPPLDNS